MFANRLAVEDFSVIEQPHRMLPEPHIVAARLVAIREGLGLSQADLCRITGFSSARWAQYETGVRPLTLAAALQLNKSFGVTLDFLFLGDPSGLPVRLSTKLQIPTMKNLRSSR